MRDVARLDTHEIRDSDDTAHWCGPLWLFERMSAEVRPARRGSGNVRRQRAVSPARAPGRARGRPSRGVFYKICIIVAASCEKRLLALVCLRISAHIWADGGILRMASVCLNLRSRQPTVHGYVRTAHQC